MGPPALPRPVSVTVFLHDGQGFYNQIQGTILAGDRGRSQPSGLQAALLDRSLTSYLEDLLEFFPEGGPGHVSHAHSPHSTELTCLQPLVAFLCPVASSGDRWRRKRWCCPERKPQPVLCFQMTGRYDMYAQELAEAVKPSYVPNIVKE